MKVTNNIRKTILADAHLLALQYLNDGGPSEVFNLGNGNGFSVKDVIKTAIKITGRDIPFGESERRPGDPAVLIGSSDKIKKVLGWKASQNSLDAIIKTARQWHKR